MLLACRGSCFFLYATVYAASGYWRVTLRRSSHRATGGNSEKVRLKQWDLEGSCLQLLRRVVVDGWFCVLSACRPQALQATPLQNNG
jgi:hypothetical protein